VSWTIITREKKAWTQIARTVKDWVWSGWFAKPGWFMVGWFYSDVDRKTQGAKKWVNIR